MRGVIRLSIMRSYVIEMENNWNVIWRKFGRMVFHLYIEAHQLSRWLDLRYLGGYLHDLSSFSIKNRLINLYIGAGFIHVPFSLRCLAIIVKKFPNDLYFFIGFVPLAFSYWCFKIMIVSFFHFVPFTFLFDVFVILFYPILRSLRSTDAVSSLFIRSYSARR